MMRKPFPWIALLLAICLIAYAAVTVHGMRPLLQYMALAPAPIAPEKKAEDEEDPPVTNAPLGELLDAYEELKDTLDEFAKSRSVHAHRQSMDIISDEQNKLTGALTGVGPGYYMVNPPSIRYGRVPDTWELRYGARVAVISEEAAYTLYRTRDPVGRLLYLDGEEYEIIGVIKNPSRVGTTTPYHVYVPLRQLVRGKISMDALVFAIRPAPGAGAAVGYEGAMEGIVAGEMIDLSKEGMRALLPVRVLLSLMGLYLAIVGVRWMKDWSARWARAMREQLRERYMRELMAQILGRAAISLLGFGALAAMGFSLIAYLVEPVYTFTEWVPLVPVEWTEIQKTFWALNDAAARVVSLRSQELLIIRQMATIVNAGCTLLVLMLMGMLAARSLRPRKT